MAPNPRWHFRAMQKGEINVDPVQDEFFKAQDLVDALVRESIQNSLDARRGSARVRVRFALHAGVHAMRADVANRYLDGLQPHLTAVEQDLAAPFPDQGFPMSFLVVEDYGTRGLSGNPHVEPAPDHEADARNDFFYFWRNVGRGQKTEKDRGRWGLGKAVFSVSSRIHTIFGLTVRPDDSSPLLLGQSVLKIHTLDGDRVAPYGFFADFEQDAFPHPVGNGHAIAKFAADFQLQREEPGLSIVVPWFRETDITFEGIIRASIDQYFYPITRGDLQVDVEESGRSESIGRDTIDAVASRHSDAKWSADAASKLCALARWAREVSGEDFVQLDPPNDGAPRWSEAILAPERIDFLRKRIEAGNRIALRVPVTVKRKRRAASNSSFEVYLERDDTLKKGEHHYIRRGITIPDVRANRDKPVRALLVVDDAPLSALLGDAENPAHSDWSERADKVRENYEHGPWTVRYVKNAIAQISSILLRPPERPVTDIHSEIFRVRRPEGGSEEAAGHRPGAGEVVTQPASTPRTPAPSLKIEPREGGFSIRTSIPLERLPRRFRLEAAYRVRQGNPFRRYHPLDFDLGDGKMTIEATGATLQKIEGNAVDFMAVEPEMRIAAAGFDVHRDLVIRLVEQEQDAS